MATNPLSIIDIVFSLKSEFELKSDFELNTALAELEGLTVMSDEPPIHDMDAVVYHNGMTDESYSGTEINYCKTWGAIMPLLEKYKISLVNVFGNNMWKARDVEADVEIWHTSPQRAIACCIVISLKAKAILLKQGTQQ